MRAKTINRNLFIIETPHQLLNAIEAVHSMHLTNNDLVIVGHEGGDRSKFIPLIELSAWTSLTYLSPYINSKPWVRKRFGPVIYRWYCRYLHFRRMYSLTELAARFRQVERLFLGHYFPEEKPFMRHIANTITYGTLYLLDDGTDTIEINERRKTHEKDEYGVTEIRPFFRLPACKSVEQYIRRKCWNWSLAEAPCVTFFTVYDLDIRKGDKLIKNDYRCLQSRSVSHRVCMPDTVVFIGQCIQDGNIEMNAHLGFLSKAREHFSEEKFVYVAHPRESSLCLNHVRESLRCEIWPSSSVIEQDLFGRGIKPKAVAGFASSAQITLACLMDPDVEMVCFEIPPKYWLGWREGAVGFYDYLRAKLDWRVRIASISAYDCECSCKPPLA